MTDLNPAESACLKLLKLCASPGRHLTGRQFVGETDATGNAYTALFTALQQKGRISIGKQIHDHMKIQIL